MAQKVATARKMKSRWDNLLRPNCDSDGKTDNKRQAFINTDMRRFKIQTGDMDPPPPGRASTYKPGGALPYITYTGMCRPTESWFWSSWFRKGYPFQRRFLERGIIFRTHESSTFVSSHLKVFKDRLLLKTRFNALISKPLYSCCTLERSKKNWPISRTGYQF